MTRPYKPKDIPGLMPYLIVRDCQRALEFYEKAFGFQPDGPPMEMNGEMVHGEMKFLDIRIMSGKEGAWDPSLKSPKNSGAPAAISLYVYCQDVDGQHQRAASAGAEITLAPADMFWGDRIFKVKDPDGHQWCFARNVGDFDPSQIPAGDG